MMPDPSKAAGGSTPISSVETREGKYLLFRLGAESYGIPALKVREIVVNQSPVAIPHTPPFVKGVINLRGKIIPIMDLRERFGLTPICVSDRTSTIVVQVGDPTTPLLAGVVVDEVLEVIEIRAAEIEPAPTFIEAVETACIIGIAKTQSGVRILIDVENILAISEWKVQVCESSSLN